MGTGGDDNTQVVLRIRHGAESVDILLWEEEYCPCCGGDWNEGDLPEAIEWGKLHEMEPRALLRDEERLPDSYPDNKADAVYTPDSPEWPLVRALFVKVLPL